MKQLQPIGHSMQVCNLLKCPKWSQNFKWTNQLISKTLNMDYNQTPNRKKIGWAKHTMVTPFGMSHCITFSRYACLNVSHLKFLKDFHNIFAHYVKI